MTEPSRPDTVRAVVWGIGVPVGILLGTILFGPPSLWALLVYPAQVIRLARRGHGRGAWERAFFGTVGKFAEAAGVLNYFWLRLRGKTAGLIEYK